MPTQRTNIQKGKFSNYGSSIFVKPTKNTRYFENRSVRKPTMRGAFPRAVKATKWSLEDEGITNSRSDYNRALNLNASASSARLNRNIDASKTIATATLNKNIYSKSKFEGNAARQLDPLPETETSAIAIPRRDMHAVKGAAKERSIFQSTALSPLLLSLSKVAVSLVVVIAVLAFVRVGVTSATVSTGLNSQEISKKIDSELVNKNALEVQDSTLGNSSRIRQAATDFALVTPTSIETINLAPDVLAYDGDQVSLVESLNRVANRSK